MPIPRGPCEGSAGRALSRGAWNPRRDRSRGPKPGALEVRHEETEESVNQLPVVSGQLQVKPLPNKKLRAES